MRETLDDLGKSWFISCIVLNSFLTSTSTVRNIDTYLRKLKLYPGKLYLLISNTTGYMKKGGVILKYIYPKMFRFTYLLHLFHICVV